MSDSTLLATEPLNMRQERILRTVEAKGYVTIEGLAADFSVSAQTVRRDIIALHDRGLVQRFHGGAGRNGGSDMVRLGHTHKRAVAVDEKRLIAEAAARYVEPGAYVFLDVGTTVEAAAAVLARRSGLTIFTNSIRTAALFDPAQHDVNVLGGQLRGADGSLVGERVVERLNALRLDVALIGCSGIEPSGAVMDFDAQKIAVKRAAIAAARAAYVLATQEKFNRTARECVAPASAFQAIIGPQAQNLTPTADTPTANGETLNA